MLIVELDSLGNAINLKHHKASSMSESEFELFFSNLKHSSTFCLYNGDPHLTFRDFISTGKNRYTYTYFYPSR